MTQDKATNVLFITWDGPETDYLEGLFLPIFEGLRRHGYRFHVLQFGWGEDAVRERRERACRASGISYRHVPVSRHLRPIGPLFTAWRGAHHIGKAVEDWGIDVLMPRSLMPAIATLSSRGKKMPVIFDADGLAADERVDFSGLSPSSWTYRLLRTAEAEIIRRADHVMTRTSATIPILVDRAGRGITSDRFTVVSNGRDPLIFAPGTAEARSAVRQKLGIPKDALLLVYAGSLGGKYCPEAMLELFDKVQSRHGDARLLVLTRDPKAIQSRLQSFPGVADRVIFHSSDVGNIPGYLSCADVGLALIKNSYSMQAAFPIKIGEYLLCGVPVIATAGIGKYEVLNELAGYTVRDHADDSLNSAADWIYRAQLNNRASIQMFCRKIGCEFFSIQSSITAYVRALNCLTMSVRSRH